MWSKVNFVGTLVGTRVFAPAGLRKRSDGQWRLHPGGRDGRRDCARNVLHRKEATDHCRTIWCHLRQRRGSCRDIDITCTSSVLLLSRLQIPWYFLGYFGNASYEALESYWISLYCVPYYRSTTRCARSARTRCSTRWTNNSSWRRRRRRSIRPTYKSLTRKRRMTTRLVTFSGKLGSKASNFNLSHNVNRQLTILHTNATFICICRSRSWKRSWHRFRWRRPR